MPLCSSRRSELAAELGVEDLSFGRLHNDLAGQTAGVFVGLVEKRDADYDLLSGGYFLLRRLRR